MSLVKCVYCKGKGKIICPECKGNKPRTKNLMQDLQSQLSVVRGKKKQKTCTLCKGRGKITCIGCMGAGFVEMPTVA